MFDIFSYNNLDKLEPLVRTNRASEHSSNKLRDEFGRSLLANKSLTLIGWSIDQ